MNFLPQKTQNPHTILVVDDDIGSIDITVQFLHAYSFRILMATTGEDGLERATLARPDLILLDICMPGINGIETCRRLKANPRTAEIPVIFMTAIADTQSKVQGLEVGAVDYVTKPIEESELLARVQTHIQLRDLQLHLEAEVQARTEALETEIQQHEKARAERELLLALLREQSEQLHGMMHKSLSVHQKSHVNTDQIAQQVRLLDSLTQQVDAMLDKSEMLEDPIAMVKQRMQDVRGLVTELVTALVTPSSTAVTADGAYRVPRHGGNHQSPRTSILPPKSSAPHPQGSGPRDTPDRAFPESSTTAPELPILKLSTREYEVFQLIAQGRSNTEISDILTVASSTVSTYRHRIMHKLGIPDPSALVKYAVEMQMF